MLFPTRALQRCCREVFPVSGCLRKYSERVWGCSAGHRGCALEPDHALGFSSDTCYSAMGILAHLVRSLPLSRLLLQQQPSYAESREKLSAFTCLLSVQEAPRPSGFPTGEIAARLHGESNSSPPLTAALAASQPLWWLLDYSGDNTWGCPSLPLWP